MLNNLEKIQPFKSLKKVVDKDQYEDLVQEVILYNYKKGQEIFSENSKSIGLYALEDGLVKLINSTDHRFVLYNIIKSDEIFNYQALVTDHKNLHTAVAMKDCVVAVLPKVKFLEIYENNRDVRECILKHLISDLKLYHEKALILAFNTINVKLAMALVYLSKVYDKDDEKNTIILNRQELADFTGSTRETIIRLAKDFESEGYIEIQKGNIIVKDTKSLEQLVYNALNK